MDSWRMDRMYASLPQMLFKSNGNEIEDCVHLNQHIHWVLFVSLLVLRTSSVVHRATKTLSCPVTLRLPSRGCTRPSLPFCFSSHTMNKCPFHGIFSVTFLHFLCFYWQFHCWKWPPNITLKCYLVFLNIKRLSCALWKKYMCSIHMS